MNTDTGIDIKEQALEIRKEYIDTKNGVKLKEKFSSFADTYPTMFELLTSDNDIDFTLLQKMLDVKQMMDKKVLSDEQGDKEVGNLLFDKFVPSDMKN